MDWKLLSFMEHWVLLFLASMILVCLCCLKGVGPGVAGTARSLEDITPSPHLTNSPKGSGQTNATSALLSAPGCGVGSASPVANVYFRLAASEGAAAGGSHVTSPPFL